MRKRRALFRTEGEVKMGETGELWREMRTDAAEKRRSNREKSTRILQEAGVSFESYNGGLHLVIRTRRGTVNFFPSTGRYTGAADGRGVFNLLKELEKEI